jgi:predicted nucleotidyltransferase
MGPGVSEPALVAALAREPAVVSAYLFGSHAHGLAHRDSDVDVAVLLDREKAATARARFDLRLRLAGELIAALHCGNIDLVILNDTPPTVARAIVTQGRSVFCRDREADHAFVRTTLLRAADVQPFLRRTRAQKLDALRR